MAALLPSYRRPLSFGALLDEAFRVYRRAWWPMLLVLAMWALPTYLVNEVFIELTNRVAPDDPEDFGSAEYWLWSLAGVVVAAVLAMPPAATLTALTDDVLRGKTLHARDALSASRRTLHRWPAAVASTLLAILLLLLCVATAVVFWAITLFGVLGVPILLFCLFTWWRKPSARGRRLRRAIVVCIPFGLVAYYFVLWALAVPAVVLERLGPAKALWRSERLVRGAWLRTAGAVTLAGLIAGGLLGMIPWALLSSALWAVNGILPWDQTDRLLKAAQSAAGSVGWVLFGAGYQCLVTLHFVDLRNRKEGADLVERVETSASAPSQPPRMHAAPYVKPVQLPE